MTENSDVEAKGGCLDPGASGVCEAGIEITCLVAIGEGDGAATEGAACALVD
jgi:hypothetical protein